MAAGSDTGPEKRPPRKRRGRHDHRQTEQENSDQLPSAVSCRVAFDQKPLDHDDRFEPQLVVHQFSMEALHSVMSHNNGQVLGLYGEMSVMYQQLDAYKHSGSTLDR